MTWLKDNWFKVGMMSSILIVAISIGYYYVVFIPESKNSEGQKNNEDVFAKKVECEKYKDEIIIKINQFNAKQKPEVRNDYNLYVESNEFKEIFYSQKINSCVYLESRKTLSKRSANADPNTGDWNTSYETYYLIDVLTNKEIDFNKGLPFLQITNRGEQFNSEKEAHDILNEYR